MCGTMLSIEILIESKAREFRSLIHINLFGKGDVNAMEHDCSV